MTTQDMAHDGAEIKFFANSVHKPWLAMCVEVLEHEVVGAQRRPPPPADKSKHAWQPLVLWLWMLRNAAFADRKQFIEGHGMIYLKRGQLAASHAFLSKAANWNRKSVRTFVDQLIAFDMITVSMSDDVDQLRLNFPGQKLSGVQKGQGMTIITICNYDKYQHDPNRKGQPRANLGPTSGQPRAIKNTTIQSLQLNNDEDEQRIAVVGGRIQLMGDLKTFWLKKFEGDETALELALLQATPYVQLNATGHTLETKVSGQLAGQLRYKRDRAKVASGSVTPFPRQTQNNARAQHWQKIMDDRKVKSNESSR